jgi:hypothetical protein
MRVVTPVEPGGPQEDQHFGEDDKEEAGGNFSTRFSLFSGLHFGK